MIVAVTCDPWKTDIFKRNLEAGGFVIRSTAESKQLTVFQIETDSLSKLQSVLYAAQKESEQAKANKKKLH